MGLRNISLFFFFWSVFLIGQTLGQTTYFWIGGDGDWQNPDNWSLNSGGAPAGLQPNVQDNVVFDANSFTAAGQQVTTSNNIFIHNMDWRGVNFNPSFNITGFDVHVAGSLYLSPAMQHDVMTNYVFNADDAGHEIVTAGQTFRGGVIFDGLGGGQWILREDWFIVDFLEFRAGTFEIGDNVINCNGVLARTNDNLTINLGTGSILMTETGVSPAQFLIGGDNITLLADMSTLVLAGNNSRLELSGPITYSLGQVIFGGGTGTVESNVDLAGGALQPSINELEFNQDGLVLGEFYFPLLRLANTHTVRLENGVTQIIDDIDVINSDCEGEARLIWQNPMQPRAGVRVTTTNLTAPVFYQGIEFIFTNTVVLNGGIDGGNNIGPYSILNTAPRIVYWVGQNGGDWTDPNNWADASGGAPGACLPRAIDNVVFDDNSFSGGGPAIIQSGGIPIIVNSFDYAYSGGTPVIFNLPELQIVAHEANGLPKVSGFTMTEAPLGFNVPKVIMQGTDQAGTTPDVTDVQIINVTNQVGINNLCLRGSSSDLNVPPEVHLEQDLLVLDSLIIMGVLTLKTKEFNIETGSFRASGQDVHLELDQSTITINDDFNGINYPLTISGIAGISALNTQWVFTSDTPGFDIDDGAVGKMLFESESGTAEMLSQGSVSFQEIRLQGDGRFRGDMYTIDSLIFTPNMLMTGNISAPPSLYVLDTNVDVTVNEYFEAFGEICAQIRITSTGPGAEMMSLNPAIELELQFLEIDDVTTDGSFFAGIGSLGRNTTTGWTFPLPGSGDNITDFLPDQINACSDSLIILDPASTLNVISVSWFENNVQVTSPDAYIVVGSVNELVAIVETPAGCPIADTTMLNIDPEFTYDLGTDQVQVCQGSQLELQDVSFNDATATYLWSTSSMMPSITVDQTDDYSVTVTRGFCVERDTVSVTRIELPPFEFAEDSLTLCSDDATTLPAPDFTSNPGATFEWDDGSTSGDRQVSPATLPADGFYRITVSEGICSDQDSIQVTFDPALDPNQLLSNTQDTTLCANESYIQSVAIRDVDSVRWNFRGLTDLDLRISASAITGSQIFEVRAWRGTCTATAQREVFATPIPIVELDPDLTICESEGSIELIKPSSINLPITWTDISGNTLGSQDTIATPVQIGTSTYILEVADGLCTGRDSINVTYDPLPPVELGMDTTICQGDSVVLTLPAGLDNFVWSNGEQSLMNVVRAAETISVQASLASCQVDTSVTISVLDITTLDLGPADTTICDGESVLLDPGLSNSVQYTWTPFNNGASTFDAQTPGLVRVVASASGCSASDSINIMVDPRVPPFALHQNIGDPDSVICRGEVLNYDFMLPGASYVWRDFSGNTLSNSGIFQIDDAGDFALDITIGACTSSDSLVVNVQENPTVNIPDSIVSCDGDVEIIDATTGNASYLWSTNETMSEISVTTSDLYIVQVTEFNCTTSDSTEVVFNPLPNATLRVDTAICDFDTVTLNFSDISVQYTWNTPLGASSDPSFDAYIGGTYFVTVTDDNMCAAIDSFSLVVNETPFYDFPDTIPFCDGQFFDLSVPTNLPASIPLTYRWFNADANPSVLIRNEGNVYVDVMTDVGCSWVDTAFVQERPFPMVELGADPVICSDSTLVLNAFVQGATYLWSTNETSERINVMSEGLFRVDVDLDGCSTSDSVMVSTIQAPEVSLGMDTTICEGNSLTLSINDPSWDAVWSNGMTTSSIQVEEEGTYSVTVQDNGCTDTDEINVNQALNPVPDLGDDIAICGQVGTTLSVGLNNVDVLWSTQETTPSINVQNSGTFSVVVTSEFGCIGMDEISISDRECVQFSLYRPNVFSPNSALNADNSTFRISPDETSLISNYEINIFDRWGNLMYQSFDLNAAWDGRISGSRVAPPGVYAYVIKVTYTDDFNDNRTDVIHGDVTLIN